MAAVINKRDVALQAASPRTVAVNLGSTVNVNGTVSGNVTGTLNGSPVADVVAAAFDSGTSNFFTSSASDPTGGASGDAHYNTSTQVMWFNVSGTWTKGGTVNASQIITGTLAAGRIASNSITSDKFNVSTLSAITSNLGTVTAGNISGSSNLTITGQATFGGSVSTGGSSYAASFNALENSPGGLHADAGVAGIAVRGSATGSGSSSIGVSGVNSTGIGVHAEATSGTALEVEGSMTVTNSSVVNFLNADMVDGKHASSLCQIVPTNSGTCTVSGNGFNLNVTGTLASTVRTRGTTNFVYIENISDARLKQDIKDEILGLDFINALKPRSFRMRDNPQIRAHGLIYQEVVELVDEADSLACVNSDGTGAVDYNGMIAPLIKSIQELTKRIEDLENVEKKRSCD